MVGSSAVAPQAAGLDQSEVSAKPLGCGPRRGVVSMDHLGLDVRVLQVSVVSLVFTCSLAVSLRSGLSGGLYSGYSLVYCGGVEEPWSFCVLLVLYI